MAVGDDTGQKGHVEEIAADGHPLVIRIEQRLARFHGVLQRRETVFAQDRESGAGAA
jgi:hypothetical protein